MKIVFLLLFMSIWAGRSVGQDTRNSNEGQDFFPIAVWAQSPEHALAYRENGINMFINIYGGLDEEKLNQLKRANMKVIARQNEFALTRLDEPSIYGWMHQEEPDNAQRNKTQDKWDPCMDPADIIREFRRIKKNDPSRPVYLNVGRGVAQTNWIGRGVCRGRTDMYKISNNGYLKGCDIASFHIYPVNSTEKEVVGKLWYVAKGIDSLQSWSNHSKPAWCWIETTRISEQTSRKPTPEEVKSEVWMALIHGARGFGYFCHSFVGKTNEVALLGDSEMISAVKEINSQVSSLAAVLNSPDTRGYARVESSNPNVPVGFMTKRKDKANYLFAISMREGKTSATFKVKSGKTVEVLGENRTIEIRKGAFQDDFSSYGVHLYRITKNK